MTLDAADAIELDGTIHRAVHRRGIYGADRRATACGQALLILEYSEIETVRDLARSGAGLCAECFTRSAPTRTTAEAAQ